jgi:hypothetical protein
MQISKYFASLGIEVDKGSVKKVDKTLDHVEKRLKKLGTFANKPITLSIGTFDIDQRKLNVALGNALDVASSRLVFEISRFSVDQMHLNRVMTAATIQASRVASEAANIRPNVGAGRTGGGRQAVATGAVAGSLSGLRGLPNFFGPALALGLGGYGLSNLNQRNQEVVSAQLQTSAVVQQAGGTAAQGSESFEYLRREGQRIGFNYLDASGDYNKLISGLTGSGIGLKESQKVFSGFAELARVNKLDKTTQNRLFRALSQVAGKGKLMSEELTGQIAEALPGGTALFAQAYQQKIGGNKTGADAIQQLLADMKKGKVTSDILTYAGTAASQRANQGGALASASQASQAEQARYQNSVNDMAVLASNSGVEEGFARIFRTLNTGLSESGDLVRGLAEGFNNATKWADDLMLFPQSFMRALEGKDSLVADWLGIDKTSQLVKDWQTVKQMFTDISSLKFDFMPTLEATAREIAMILNQIAEFQKWKSNLTGSTNENAPDASFLSQPITWAYQNTGRLFNGMFDNFDAAKERGRAVYEDPTSPYYQDPAGYDSQQADMAKAAAEDKAMGIVTNNSNQIDIVVNVDGSTLQGMDASAQAQAIGEAVANMFVQSFEQVNVQFPVKQ